jgi:hypothetical protein
MARMHKVKQLKITKQSKHIFSTTGLMRAALYGGDAGGWAPEQIGRMRHSMASTLLGTKGRGCLTNIFALHSDTGKDDPAIRGRIEQISNRLGAWHAAPHNKHQGDHGGMGQGA